MSASKTGASKKDLVKGAINANLAYGYSIRLSEDGEMLIKVDNNVAAYEPTVIPPETFLRAVGFTLNTPQDIYICMDIVSGMFKFIGHIKFSHFRNMVKAIDVALHDPGSIGLY